MAKHKFITMLQRRLRYTLKFCYRAIAKRLRKLLRPVFAAFRRRSNAQAGFVLPTAALLLLVVSLVIGAMLIRTFNRTEQVIGQRQEKVIYNAATPAIDRAKAKIEYLFKNDARLPGGVPSQERLLAMMLNEGTPETPQLLVPDIGNPYKLPDEERITLGGNANSLAWRYPYDSNGDGENDSTIAYSIIFQIPNDVGKLQNQSEGAISDRANALQVRHGPLSAEAKPGCENVGTASRIEAGWLRDPASTAILRKNFQINAVAVPDDSNNGTIATLELQQDRQADRGNKWGAWFRNDLEIAPGQQFFWNGAMHTEGSLFVGNSKLEAFLVSGPGSCIFSAGADTSEITLAEAIDENDDFVGQAMAGALAPDVSGNAMQGVFHEWVAEDEANYGQNGMDGLTLNNQNHSVNGGPTPSELILDPVKLFTEDVSAYRGNFNSAQGGKTPWQFPLETDQTRIYSNAAARPYIDDFYRADDRYGPRPAYGSDPEFNLIQNADGVGLGKQNGEDITGQPQLTTLNAITSGTDVNPTELGFDGFWERRAWREGMRVIVGPRLELGNDPLPVPTDYNIEDLDIPGANPFNNTRQHETLQRRALRDNLAAVQATAIYHKATGTDAADYPPVAAVATTVHPGTADTLARSASFEQPIQFKVSATYNTLFGTDFGNDPNEMLIDFLTGRGTNGWEFDIPNGFFGSAQVDTALENLANFAGDYESANQQGAFPPTQANGIIHPYPELTKWGNFSNLRRAIEAGNGSIADESYKHTAALTLGMLAYNISYLDAFDYQDLANVNRNNIQNNLVPALETLRDGDVTNGEVQVVIDGTPPQRFVEVYEDNPPATPNPPLPIARWELDDGEMPPPEAYIAALPEDEQALARLLHLKEQVKLSRTRGFAPSPLDLGAVGTTPRPRYQYAVRFFHEDADGDGTLDDGEDLNGNGVLDLIYDDANNNGDWDRPTEGVITGSEDINSDSFLSAGEDDNNNGILDTPFVINLTCDFSQDTGNNFFGFGEPTDEPTERQFIDLANSLCGQNVNEDTNDNSTLDSGEDTNGNTTLDYTAAKYPSLYYLFPITNHDFDTGQPPDNSYISDTYIQGLNGGTNYSVVDLPQIALTPKPIGQWILPHEDNVNPSALCGNNASATNINPNCGRYNLVYNGVDDEYHRVAFKDTGFFNGREMMNVRALSMDLNMLKEENTPGGDLWLAVGDDDAVEAGGMVYAFREDAVREDGIARPAGGGSCDTFADITSAGCRSRATGNNIQDPAVNAANGISPKPVDFYPDPDRRPHGFRLINGADLSRDSAGLTSYGLTFISDNPTYVQGNFNCHAASVGADNSCPEPLEEFNFTIRDKADLDAAAYRQAFYDRRKNQNQLNNNFATPENDVWRFSELLVDGLTILSDNFCEGSIEDGFITAGGALERTDLRTFLGGNRLGRATNNNPTLQQVYGCANANEVYTSYLNQNRPSTDQESGFGLAEIKKKWRRENPADPSSPIRVSKNGNPLLSTGEDYSGNYFTFEANYPGTNRSFMKPMNRAKDQQLNGLFLSGIIPSQGLQTYGGLHNFPRFIEDWVGLDASISGSFYQLNFSTQATGLFDQDAWEPDEPPQRPNWGRYYGAPNRFWGYDTALQLAAPGPIAVRLVSINNRRSEFYRELPLDDPYIDLLYQAIQN